MIGFISSVAALTSSSFRRYFGPGVMGSLGFDPTGVSPTGSLELTMGSPDVPIVRADFNPKNKLSTPMFPDTEFKKLGFGGMVDKYGWKTLGKSFAAPALNIGSLAYFAYQGYKEDGISGAVGGVVQDVALMSALNRFGYTAGNTLYKGKFIQGTGIRLAGMALSPDKLLLRGVGAGIGGEIGRSIGGTPGAFIGSFIGAAPLRFLQTSSVAAGVGLAIGAAAVASYGTYSVVKGVAQEGYDRRQRLRGVNTAGDMASFMTQSAFTMRERAVQAMSKSHLNARSALGQESTLMSRPYVNPLSRYR